MVAEAFSTAWSEREAYDEKRGVEFAWLTGILINRCRNHRRSRQGDRALVAMRPPVAAGDEQVIERVAAAQARELMFDALALLPAPQRLALLLTAVGEMEPSEIADVLGVPASTVRSDLRRARLTVAPLMERHLR
jgi:RNA polymerase sigma-70 factor (ECF subfamily)